MSHRSVFQEYQSLEPEERVLVDELHSYILNFADGLAKKTFSPTKLVARKLAKSVVSRLLEKLRENGINQSEVGDIAEGVWLQLNHTTAKTPALEQDPAKVQVVDDIMAKANMLMPYFQAQWDEMVSKVGKETGSKIIRIAAALSWPHVRDSFAK